MDYGDLLTKGFNLVWKNRLMWLLGLLASLGAISMSQGGTPNESSQTDLQEFIEIIGNPTSTEIPEFPAAFKGFIELSEMLETNPELAWAQVSAGLVPFILLSIFLSLLFFVVRTVALAGLIKSAYALDGVAEDYVSEKSGGDYWREGFRYFGRLFGLRIVGFILAIIGYVLFVGQFLLVASTGTSSVASFLIPFCLVSCIFIFFAFLWLFISPFASRGIVLEDMGIFKSLGHGWQVFSKSAGEILVMGVVFGILIFIWFMIVSLILRLFGSLLGGDVLFEFFRTGVLTLRQGLILAVGSLLSAILTALFLSIFRAWVSTVFTLGYKNFWRERAMGDSGDEDLEFGV